MPCCSKYRPQSSEPQTDGLSLSTTADGSQPNVRKLCDTPPPAPQAHTHNLAYYDNIICQVRPGSPPGFLLCLLSHRLLPLLSLNLVLFSASSHLYRLSSRLITMSSPLSCISCPSLFDTVHGLSVQSVSLRCASAQIAKPSPPCHNNF